jgi:AraC-like DNA-binding protein
LVRFKKTHSSDQLAQNRVLLKWLFTFNSMLTAVLIVTILKVFLPVLKNTHLTVADILLAATIIFICLQLFIRPQILYGIFSPLPKLNSSNEISAFQNDLLQNSVLEPVLEIYLDEFPEKAPNTINIEPAEQLRYKNLVENHFQKNKPFLKTDYSLEQLVRDIHIPRYILSAFINREYGMGFREFLNRHRVDYMKANLGNATWKQFTLEAIAAECGFSSRVTFFNNFKQITGQSPSEYIKAHQKI